MDLHSRDSVQPVWDRPVLGIETSCDETAAAVVAGNRILSNVIFSQTEHSLYGGVVPELASRNHVRKIVPVVREALSRAGVGLDELGGIAVTRGPGLVGCLLVGISTAKGLAFGSGRPLIGVHHIEGHLFAGLLGDTDLRPPFLALVISGGHTQLIHVRRWGLYEICGETRDDAAGEAFDKVAKMLGLLKSGETTMGGPAISRLAEEGDAGAFAFPRGLRRQDGFEFSFSGIKTSVLYHLKSRSEADVCGATGGYRRQFPGGGSRRACGKDNSSGRHAESGSDSVDGRRGGESAAAGRDAARPPRNTAWRSAFRRRFFVPTMRR